MNDIISIQLYPSKSPSLIISDVLAEKLGLSQKSKGYVSFGCKRSFVNIFVSSKPEYDEIFLTANVIKNLHIPVYPSFEVLVNGDEIVVGPCIGILASQKYENITRRRLDEIYMNMLDYEQIHGAVIVFSLDSVDRRNHLINGYCYNPGSNSWIRGIFPYPASIYLNTFLNSKWCNHFQYVIGNTVFNNYSFDKWEMYRWFSQESDLLPHLPETIIYKSGQNIYDMLQKHGTIYVKPLRAVSGFDTVMVSAENEKILFRYGKGENKVNIFTQNNLETVKTMEKLFKPHRHIIQQGLELLKHSGEVVNFRCIMQKDYVHKWICNSIAARYGTEGSEVMCMSKGSDSSPAVMLMKEIFSLPDTELVNLKDEIFSLSMKVCCALDERGINVGTLGLDFGIDEYKNLWLIEVNNCSPLPKAELCVKDLLSYHTMFTSPLHYAKSLARF